MAGKRKRKGIESFSSIQLLLEDVIAGSDSGQVKELAYLLSVSREAIYQKASENRPEKRFNLRDFEAICRIFKDPRLIEFFAARSGLKIVALPLVDMLEGGIDKALRELVESSAEVYKAYIDARDPDGPGGSAITSAEQMILHDVGWEHLRQAVAYIEKIKGEAVAHGV